MSAGEDALREMAANRGCRLVKSRVRTPGKGDYGHYGLKDAKSGRPVLGFGERGLTASATDVEEFLRRSAATSWKSALAKVPARPKAAAPTSAKAQAKPQRPATPAQTKPVIRSAQPKDVEMVARLIAELGYEVTVAEVRTRLAALGKAGLPALVVTLGGIVAGVVTLSLMTVLHRPRPVGRISMLAVSEAQRGRGLGTLLVAAAEDRLKAKGCGLVEVTSNRKRVRAHRFYERLGYERTSFRFARSLRR